MSNNTAFFRIQVDGADKLEQDLTQLTEKSNQLKLQKQQLNKELKSLDTSSANYSKRSKELNAQLAKTDIELKEVNTDLRQNQKAYLDSAAATEKASGSINQLRAQLRQAQKAYDNLSKEQRENEAVGGKQLKTIQKLDSKLKNLEGSTGRNQRNVGNYKEAVNGLLPVMGSYGGQLQMVTMQLGAVKTALVGMSGAQKGQAVATSMSTKALKFFRIALISTGIGAIVVALGSLVAAFLSTQRGVDEMNRVLKPLQSAFGAIVGLIQKRAITVFEGLSKALVNPKQLIIDIGDAIKENLLNRVKALGVFGNAIAKIFDGEFAEGFKELGNASIQLVSGQENAIDKLVDVAQKSEEFFKEAAVEAERGLAIGKQLQALTEETEKIEISLAANREKLRFLAEEQLNLARDKKLTDEERLSALAKAEQFQNNLLTLEESLLEKKVEQKRLENSINDTSREDALELARLEGQLNAARLKNEKERGRIISQRVAIENRAAVKQEAEEKKAREDKKKAEENLTEYIANLEQEMFMQSIDDKQKAELQKLEITRNAKIKEIQLSVAAEEKKQKAINLVNQKFDNERAEIELQKEQEIKEKEEQQRQEVRQATIDSAEKVAGTLIEVTKARAERKKEIELRSLNAQLEQGTITQEQFDKRSEEIERKAFKRDKRASTLEAIINGAVAFTKALSKGPILGPILAGTVAAQTAGQVAVINSQQFAEGGFTGGGFGNPDSTGFKVAGVVHENEYVVPKSLINEPEVASLERKRMIQPSIGSLRGFAQGGFTSGVSNVSLDSSGLSNEIITGVTQSLNQIRVVNVSQETTSQSDRVKQIENINSF
jgi:hypothetical protein